MTPAITSRIPATWICLLVLLAVGAAWVRLHELGARPMHADEANQAVKLGALIERGEYAFDPYDHHGPTLYYFARVTAWVRGEHRLAELTEVTVRLTPALFGVAGVVLLAVAALPLGQRAALMAASLLAISPAAVYFSRYFIQETLLMTFTLAAWVAGVQAFRSRRVGWAVVTGLMLGLMQATKASAPLFIVAALLAWWGSRWNLKPNGISAGSELLSPHQERRADTTRKGGKTLFLWGALGFVAAFVTFYSSFFTHARGVVDALATYAPMGGRVSTGESGHDKPWWYYGELFWRHRRGGYLWDQNLFLGLSLLGLVWNAFCRNRTARGVSLYLALAELAARRRTPAHVRAMEDALIIMADETLGTELGRQADLDFHAALIAAAGNEALASLSSSIEAAIAWSTRYKISTGAFDRDSVPDHRAVCEAVSRGDEGNARWYMETLVRLALRDTLSSMEALRTRSG